MSKLTPEEFREYLKTVRALAEGPFEEMQKEVEVTNKFPQEFYDLAIETDFHKFPGRTTLHAISVFSTTECG